MTLLPFTLFSSSSQIRPPTTLLPFTRLGIKMILPVSGSSSNATPSMEFPSFPSMVPVGSNKLYEKLTRMDLSRNRLEGILAEMRFYGHLRYLNPSWSSFKAKIYKSSLGHTLLQVLNSGCVRNKAIKESERAAGNNIFYGKVGILCLLK
ncbi:putative inactive leucine-rich repeat receptor-like protein kinase, partial [Cucurbita argyrosperma subsp. sororia]